MSYTLESIGGMDGIPNDMKSSVEHLHSAYDQCLHLEHVLTKAEEECEGAQFFPNIACRRPFSSKTTSAGHAHSQRHTSRYVDPLMLTHRTNSCLLIIYSFFFTMLSIFLPCVSTVQLYMQALTYNLHI